MWVWVHWLMHVIWLPRLCMITGLHLTVVETIIARTLTHMGLKDGAYVYMQDLLQLSSPPSRRPTPPVEWPVCPSPINYIALGSCLAFYPDQRLASYVLLGVQYGFRIGTTSAVAIRSSMRNHPSSHANRSVVQSYIASEVGSGCMIGPLPPSRAAGVHVSPIGLVPKGHQANAWRMIVDLSHPTNHSVNDSIPPEFCSLHYPSVDDAFEYIMALGRHTQLTKLDLKSAYRILPIHPDDRHLLGVQWDSKVYVDQALPFGLRSAPKVFTAFADALAWILHHRGIRFLIHYLDDFLLFGTPGTAEGLQVRQVALATLAELGVPVAYEKLEGPATTVTFLGVLIDTARFEAQLPQEKLSRLRGLVAYWQGRRSGSRSDLESLLGYLSHAATIIKPGRIFLRHLFSLLSRVRARHYHVHLDSIAKADLSWWMSFLESWNGTSFFIPQDSPAIYVYSDASGAFGGGAFTSDFRWFQLQWPLSWSAVDIAAIWGRSWQGCRVIWNSDMAVVEVIRKRSTRQPILLHLLRCLYFYAAYYKFHYSAHHIPGVANVAADAISRNNLSLFLSLIPQAASPSQIPQAVQDLLLSRQPDWGSPTWTSLFISSLSTQ